MKVELSWLTVLKGEKKTVLTKVEEWNPGLRASGEVYSMLGYLLTFPFKKLL